MRVTLDYEDIPFIMKIPENIPDGFSGGGTPKKI